MRVLVACEYSGTVRDAFIRAGHYAASCDLLPSESPLGDHYQCSVLDILDHDWDLMIAHPPCTHLAVSGARWFKDKQQEQLEALEFVRQLLAAPIPRIALENPVSIISSHIRKPDQIIQPYQFGHEATKTTCLWLKDLPLLIPTKVVGKGDRHVTKSGKSLPTWYNLPPSADRWKIRSATFKGIADAMASQWGVDSIQGSLL
jgi:site-specific DNA-cytosine methylase